MKDAHFRPVEPNGNATERVPVERIAPTEPESPGGRMLRGVVHDPRSRALGGVAGHAGLFATADDLAVYAQTLLNGGIGPERPTRAVAAGRPRDDRRRRDPGGPAPGPGMGRPDRARAPRGGLFGPDQLRPHGVHRHEPLDRPGDRDLRHRPRPAGSIPTAAAPRRPPCGTRWRPWPRRRSSMRRPGRRPRSPATTGPAPVGRDRARTAGRRRDHPMRDRRPGGAEVPPAPSNKRVGLVTNHTGRTRGGASTIDVLFRAPDVKLVKLFSPEHGIRGVLDTTVSDSVDEATGLPIVSLYGKDRKPQPRDLEGIDVLVYDIQDIGARFYTYITTLGPGPRGGRGGRQGGRGARPPQPDRRPRLCRGRCGTRSSPRSSPTTRCPSGTG